LYTNTLSDPKIYQHFKHKLWIPSIRSEKFELSRMESTLAPPTLPPPPLPPLLSLLSLLLEVECLRNVADEGDAESQVRYGLRLKTGDGVGVNNGLAAHYFKLATDQKYPGGEMNYGLLLVHRDGVAMTRRSQRTI
jgi:TPR repeat protein